MNKFNKSISIIALSLLVVSLNACGKTEQSSEKGPFEVTPEYKAIKPDLVTLGKLPQPILTETEREKERTKIGQDVTALLNAEEYDELEKLADKLLKSKETYVTGTWKLDSFGFFCANKTDDDNESQIRARIAQLESWHKAKPDSPYPPVALAEAYTGLAWEARGGGWASEVEDDGWKGYNESLKTAKEWLDKAEKYSNVYPRWYEPFCTIALGQGMNKTEYAKILDKGLKDFPTYNEIYFRQIYFLQPRWYGDKGEWEKYAKKKADALGGDEGDILYARMIWQIQRQRALYKNNSLYTDSDASWSRTESGFELLSKKYRDSVQVLNGYCRAAVTARDVPVARRLFQQIGERCVMSEWGKRPPSSMKHFINCRKWAYGDTDYIK